ncbi:MAG TPA: S41 family peptidase [Gemmatimonadaceae bacterium]|nr:S41 family peptidase [Gemmatimonadaceae bacterium]
MPNAMHSRWLVAVATMCGALLTGGWLLQHGLHRSDNTVVRARLFDGVLAHVERDFVDSLPEAELYRKATDGMLKQLGDPYTAVLTPDRMRRFAESTAGRYAGLGIQIDVRDGWITVVTPLPGTPAERAGIQAGDRIVGINEQSTSGWSPDEAQDALRGPAGSSVTLAVERPGVAAKLSFRLERADIHVASVRHSTMLNDGVGYVQLTIFSEASAAEIRTAVTALRRRGMRTLLLDLRENPGGLLEQGVAVSDLFLDPGDRVVTMRGRDAASTRDFADNTTQLWPDLRVIALVDGHTASAAEIVAGALQDHDRALILGATTFGKGSAQSIFTLHDSAGALKMTTAHWFTPSGRSIQRAAVSTADGDEGLDTPDDSAAEAPLSHRHEFHTDAGRVVYGGGGITPDLLVTSAARDQALLTFYRHLGADIPRFRDVATDYALDLKASHAVTKPDFTITPAMRAEFARRLARRGVKTSVAQLDSSTAAVDRLLAREIARYVFGPDAEFQRELRDDRVIESALQLTAGAATQRELLARAASRRAEKQEDLPPPS